MSFRWPRLHDEETGILIPMRGNEENKAVNAAMDVRQDPNPHEG